MVEKVGTKGREVEYALVTAGHMDMDCKQVSNALERKIDIIIL